MEFSCIGDAVNLSSRTEGLTKLYGVVILITENTLMETGDLFVTREIDAVVVKGKNRSVRIFELICKRGDPIPQEIQQVCHLFSIGLDLYRRKQFEEAIGMFTAAHSTNGDGPSKVFIRRCEQYIESPPPCSWNAVYVAEEK